MLGAWAFSGLGLYAFQNEVIFALWILAAPIYLIHLLIGAVLLFEWGGRALSDHWFPAWPAGAVIASQVVFLLGAPQLVHAAALVRLALERPRMEAIVANAPDARRLDPVRRQVLQGDWDGAEYIYDFGPPMRVAFQWYDGIGDWGGVVWDPSGGVAQAKGWDTPRHIQRLFGGVLMGCRRLWGPYYRCSFT